MKDIEFPIFKTKVEGLDKKFDLVSPEGIQEYFEAKAGKELNELRDYLKDRTFIAYLLGKKNAGKGTYTKMLSKAIGGDKIAHISIGDLVREVYSDVQDETKRNELEAWLRKNYRGFISVDQAMEALVNKDQSTLLPTEFILALVKRKIELIGERKSLFIDGFPRKLDQISYSLFFRELVNYRQDPDVFVLIDLPESAIDERIKYRVICPKCQTSRNLKGLPTSKIGYDEETEEYYLMCDNEECGAPRMVRKEGDELGIAPIRKRLDMDESLIKQAFSLYGIPKVLLRNSIPVDKADEYVDEYELTPVFDYNKEDNGEITVSQSSWKIKDDNGVMSYSLMAPPVAVSFIKQLAEALRNQ
jgi:adenylate kinase family enzyme